MNFSGEKHGDGDEDEADANAADGVPFRIVRDVGDAERDQGDDEAQRSGGGHQLSAVLLGQLVVAGLHRQHRLALPFFGLDELLIPLLLQAFLIPDGDSDLLLGLDQLRLHVDEDLVEHLLGVFGLRDQVVEVRLDQCP